MTMKTVLRRLYRHYEAKRKTKERNAGQSSVPQKPRRLVQRLLRVVAVGHAIPLPSAVDVARVLPVDVVEQLHVLVTSHEQNVG